MHSTPEVPPTYLRAVDGLRALAILPVLLLHAGFPFLPGGFVGVDVFFVISGFLISRILLAEMTEPDQTPGTFSPARFYERRARRILPPLLLVLLGSLLVGWLCMLPQELQTLGQSLLASLLFASNAYFWQTSNYFSPGAQQLPLLHTWSLAVEEQFYLLFPWMLHALHQRRQRAGGLLLGLAAVLSLLLAQWASQHLPIANFYLLPSRAWELLAGAALAWQEGRVRALLARPPALAQGAGLLGLGLLVFALLALDHHTPFPGLYALLPVAASLLLIAGARPGTVAGGLLATPLLVGIGRVSYSAYLWHQPLRVFARYSALDMDQAWAQAALVLATLLLAALTWLLLERPLGQRRLLANPRALGLACTTGLGLLGAAALAVQLGQGYAARGKQPLPAASTYLDSVDTGWCFYSVDSLAALPLGRSGPPCVLGHPRGRLRGRLRGLLVGDSFAGQYEPLWDVLGKQAGWRLEVLTTNWCYPSLGSQFPGPASSRANAQCQLDRNAAAQHLPEYDFVVIGADWRNLLLQGLWEDAQAFIRAAARQVPHVVLMPTPQAFDSPAFLRMQRALFFGRAAAFDAPQQRDALARVANQRLQDLAQALTGVRLLAREQPFQVHGRPSALSADGLPFSLDGSHISVHGALAAAQQFERSVYFGALQHWLEQGPRRAAPPRPRTVNAGGACGPCPSGDQAPTQAGAMPVPRPAP